MSLNPKSQQNKENKEKGGRSERRRDRQRLVSFSGRGGRGEGSEAGNRADSMAGTYTPGLIMVLRDNPKDNF